MIFISNIDERLKVIEDGLKRLRTDIENINNNVNRKLEDITFVLNFTKNLYNIQDKEKILYTISDLLLSTVGYSAACFIYEVTGDKLSLAYFSCDNDVDTGIDNDIYIDTLRKDVHLHKGKLVIPLYGDEVSFVVVLDCKDYVITSEFLNNICLVQPILINALRNVLGYESLLKGIEIDELTGAYNRRYLNRYYNELFDGDDYRFVMCILDVDDLKYINDTFKHTAGDVVLKTLVDVIRDSIRGTDVICRFGGDEFVIFFTHTDNDEKIYDRVESIRKDIEKININHNGYSFNFTVSFGVIPGRDILKLKSMGKSKQDIINILDSALYNSKKRGKNMTTIFTKDDLLGVEKE